MLSALDTADSFFFISKADEVDKMNFDRYISPVTEASPLLEHVTP